MNPITVNPIGPITRGSLRMQSDARLVKLFRRGVEPAFDELVRRHRGALVNYAGAIAGHDHAEDVVQDALVKAHRSLAAGEQTIEPKPWLYTVVRNTALNDIRDNRKHRHSELGESASRSSQTHDIVEQREHFAAVLAAVSDLPEAQRRALVDHELGGFTHEEIAAGLELSTGATKQLIYRARLTLRNTAGAVIPIPLIVWLAADTTGVVATGAATGVAAGAGLSSATGGGAVGSSGILAGIAGAGATKIAVVAVVAGGTLAAGVTVERNKNRSPGSSDTPASISSASAVEPGVGRTTAAVPTIDAGSAPRGGKAGTGPGSKGDSPGSQGGGSGKDEAPKPRPDGGQVGSGSDRPVGSPPPGSSGEDSSGHGGSHSGGSGSGPAVRPPKAPGGGSGSYGGGGSHEGGSGSGGDDDYYGGSSGSGSGSGSGGSGSDDSEDPPEYSGSGSGSGDDGSDDNYPDAPPRPEKGSGSGSPEDDDD